MIQLFSYKCTGIKKEQYQLPVTLIGPIYMLHKMQHLIPARKSAIENFKILVQIVTLVSIISILECQNKLKNSSVIQNTKDLKEQHFAVLIFPCVCDISLTHCWNEKVY